MTTRVFPPGRVVGPYVLQGLLGRTPWATTYAALTPPNRHVAIKLLDVALVDMPGVLDAFEASLVPLTRLSDDVLLRPVDAGEDDETGSPFIVSALSAHPSLAELVSVEPLGIAEVVVMLEQLGRALDESSGAGLMHLALKPTNVFIGPPPSHGVLLADFGMDVLRRASADFGHEADATWLAPEQIDERVPDSTRSDVYGAALLTFFALTGRELQSPSGTLSTSKPSVRAAALGATLDPVFDDILIHGLAAQPSERFASVTELADALATTAARAKPSVTLPPDAAKRHAQASGHMQRFLLPEELASSPSPDAPPAEDRKISARTARMASFKLPSPDAPRAESEGEPAVRTLLMSKFQPPARGATQRLDAYQLPPEADPRSAPGHDTVTARRPRFGRGGWTQLLELARSKPLLVLGIAGGVAAAGVLVAILTLLLEAR